MGDIKPIVFDDFDLIDGLEITDTDPWWSKRRVIQLSEGSRKGLAEFYFFEPSAKYDLTLYFVDGIKSDSEINILINGRSIGNIKFGLTNSFREENIRGINVAERSKITLEFNGVKEEKCRVEKIEFNCIGAYEGGNPNLVKPKTLRIYNTKNQQDAASQLFPDFVRSRIDSLKENWNRELAGLNTPNEWKAKQEEIRGHLHKFFGTFPEKTSLNAKVVGKIERELYTIEKIIYESQPNYYVTANLYIPKSRKFPVPGVVFPCGHSSDAKARDRYHHKSGLGLVLKGYVVLIIDPIGQGESVLSILILILKKT